jgi:hypothetical protein
LNTNKGVSMQKIAQRMGTWQTIREHTNLGGLAKENVFDPEFKEIMDKLRDDTDDPIRAIVSGNKIGKASPPDNHSLKDLLKLAKSNFNRREYMKCIADLGRFHKRMNDVIKIINSFQYNLDKVHHRFLFDRVTPGSTDYDPEYAEYIKNLKEQFSAPRTANYFESSFIKEAGILDFFKNIGTERGRALSAWEKRYPARIKELKTAIKTLLDRSDSLLTKTLSTLKQMASYRASRQVDDYINSASRIAIEYKPYDALFKSVYEKHIKKFVESPEFSGTTGTTGTTGTAEPTVTTESTDSSTRVEAPEEQQPKAEPSESFSQQLIGLMQPSLSPAPESTSPGDLAATPPATSPQPINPPDKPKGRVRKPSATPASTGAELAQRALRQVSPPPPVPAGTSVAPAPQPAAQNPAIKIDPNLPKEEQERLQKLLDRQNPKKGNQEFFESLQVLSNEHPIVLAKFILKYAKAIEKSDPITYDNLINIIKSIQV